MTAIDRRRLLLLAPLGVVAAGGAAFWAMLNRMEQGRFDPHALDNPILGKPIPNFALSAMPPGQGFGSAELRRAAARGPVLVNYFASWCIPCAEEADVLGTLAQQGLPIWGIAYKDKPEGVAQFLGRYGNPYARLADDRTGRTAIDWGVYGYPESFLIDHQGNVRWHIAMPLTPQTVHDELDPAKRTL